MGALSDLASISAGDSALGGDLLLPKTLRFDALEPLPMGSEMVSLQTFLGLEEHPSGNYRFFGDLAQNPSLSDSMDLVRVANPCELVTPQFTLENEKQSSENPMIYSMEPVGACRLPNLRLFSANSIMISVHLSETFTA